MEAFAFDETKNIESNLREFFKHLEAHDKHFAAFLATELPPAVEDDFDRAAFNESVVKMLSEKAARESEPK